MEFGIFYPHDSVLAAYAVAGDAARAERALAASGVLAADVSRASGVEVIAHERTFRADHARVDRFKAFVARHHGDDAEMLDPTLALARRGDTFVVVHAPGAVATARAATALRSAGPSVLRAYGRFTMTDLLLDASAADQSDAAEPGLDTTAPSSPEDPTTRGGVPARNATLARAELAAYNDGEVGAADWMYAVDYVDHDPPPAPYAGVAGRKAFLGLFRAAVPDARFTVDVMVAEGDVVARRWTQRGTWTGPLLGHPPTGRPVAVTGIDVLRFRDARVVEIWHHEDTSALAPTLMTPSGASAASPAVSPD